MVTIDPPVGPDLQSEARAATVQLWGLVITHHAAADHPDRPGSCPKAFCSPIRHVVNKLRLAIVASGSSDPTADAYLRHLRPEFDA